VGKYGTVGREIISSDNAHTQHTTTYTHIHSLSLIVTHTHARTFIVCHRLLLFCSDLSPHDLGWLVEHGVAVWEDGEHGAESGVVKCGVV
jgi:hypothetical protein